MRFRGGFVITRSRSSVSGAKLDLIAARLPRARRKP